MAGEESADQLLQEARARLQNVEIWIERHRTATRIGDIGNCEDVERWVRTESGMIEEAVLEIAGALRDERKGG